MHRAYNNKRTVKVARQVIQTKHLRVGTAFSGLNATVVALRGLAVQHRCRFNIENDLLRNYAAQSLNLPNDMLQFGDIMDVDPRDLPETDVFQFSQPCTHFAPCGNGEGAQSQDTDMITQCAKYLAAKLPKVWIYENPSTILTHKKHKVYLHSLLRTFRSIGRGHYKVLTMKLNARTEGSVPMNRMRAFIVGLSKDAMVSEFEVPGPIPRKLLATFLEMGSIGQTLPTDAVKLRNLMWGSQQIVERNGMLSE